MSLISDGSTDTASSEAEILYLRHCHRGILRTDFVGIKNVPKADAAGITTAISNILTDNLGDTWKTKIVGMATDGAAVMLGKTNGVVARLMREVQRPFIQTIHCSAHRLELAYKDATKSLDIFNKVDNMLLAIYLFYKNSPLNRANLKASFNTLAQKPLIPSRVGGTRWLPHIKRALENLLIGYEPIMQHLTQIQNPNDAAHRKDSANK
ncbi:PREDICTED: zinc finger protein 862-like, partial [Priapulus caudatus]|uniref:Zinc finger protein 862-like n=1 Tax=Priapulus caudatus TaxID=37621 RepID=A0ABM1EIW2_PRICU